MEPDRYQNNHGLYITGMICFLISIILFLFSLYMLPHLLFGWRYDVPELITFIREWLVDNFAIATNYASWGILFVMLFFAAVFACVAQYATRQLDHVVPDLNLPPKTKKLFSVSRRSPESTRILVQITSVCILAYLVIKVIEFLIRLDQVS
jgi:hypothetical protein